MKICERIKIAREKIGISQSELARRVGVKPQSVQVWESGRNGPSRKRISILAKELKVTPQWLEFGTEPSGTTLQLVGEEDKKPEPFPADKYAFIPRYEAKTSAGSGYHNEEHIEISQTLAYRKDWLKSKGLTVENLCVVEASGDSMSPHIEDGESILIDLKDITIRSGEIYAFQTPEGLRIKRFFWQADSRLKISSDNPDKGRYPDEVYSGEEVNVIKIIGRKVWRGG